ncbi:MAG: TolC family protein [Pelagimonas sp.]|uniref:TolC family protein n=1 Tax=Pelagimonas sp. TaxID=2073170 RepID=UPI003D6B5B38
MSMSRRSLGLIIAVAMLPGCMKDMGEGVVSRFKGAEPQASAPASKPKKAVVRASDASEIIRELQGRQAVLISGTPYSRVADAVIASDARVAEAELRVARLREQAAKYNWLPSIGPRVSLNSLGDFVADLVINQVIFDNGRKKAERDLAKANVELAAVTLVEDGNQRVHEALSLYLEAEHNRDKSRRLAIEIQDMSQFEWVMQQRVDGGISDMSDLNVLKQKISSMRARSSEAQEATVTAMAELNAMSSRNLNDLRGIGGLRADSTAEALGVLRARGEQERTIAEAKISRAGHLPGLSANASGGQSATSMGVEVTTDTLFSLGTMAEFEALEVVKETAARRVVEAREDAARDIAAQSRQLDAFRRQAIEAATLSKQAKENLDLFQAQYDGGQRQVMDVVGVYETYIVALAREIDLKYKAARAELELARLRGGLAEGAQI